MPGERSGFTLIEASVALLIVTVTGVAALATAGTELRTGDHAREALEVEALAEQRLATLRLLPGRLLRFLPDSVAQGRFDAPFDRYGWTVTTHSVMGEESLIEATVQVSWEGGASAPVVTRLYSP